MPPLSHLIGLSLDCLRYAQVQLAVARPRLTHSMARRPGAKRLVLRG